MAGEAPAVIDRAADLVLTVPCGEERAGAKTKGYHCTILNLMLLGLAVASRQRRLSDEERKALLIRMDTTFNHLPTLIEASQAWVLNHARPLIDSADIRLTGPARLFGTVQEGALKMLETLRCPVAGYEFEEFIHGIYNAFDERSTLIMLDPFPDERQDRWRKYLAAGLSIFIALVHKSKITAKICPSHLLTIPTLRSLNILFRYKWFVPDCRQ